MKTFKKWRGTALITLGMVVMVIETIYFGLNATAQSSAELIWDAIYAIMICAGICLGAYDWVDHLSEKLVLKLDYSQPKSDEQTSV